MAKKNFEACMEEVFLHEGGLSMIRSDPGNWTGGKVGVGELRGTKYGIAAHAHPGVDIQNLTKAQAREIYRRQYWAPVRGDDLPAGLDLVTFDPAVNSGVRRGSQWLQKALGLHDPDGKVGPVTLQAARAADPVATVKRACAVRMGFLQGLKTWGTFGKGWSRRVASVEAVSVRMAVEAMGGKSRPVLLDAKAEAGAKAKTQVQAAGGTAVTSTGGATLADLSSWGLIAVGLIALVVIINLLGRRRHELDRVAAYQQAAEEAKP
jgi:lysozyme family protein